MRPLTKDGGATLNEHHSLFGLAADAQSGSILRDWDYLLE